MRHLRAILSCSCVLKLKKDASSLLQVPPLLLFTFLLRTHKNAMMENVWRNDQIESYYLGNICHQTHAQHIHSPYYRTNERVPTSEHGIPRIGFGTWDITGDAVDVVISAAIDAGYRHFDCAWVYRNEKEIGQSLKKIFNEGKVKREDLFITSKLWNTHKSPEAVRKAVEFSMESLGVDYLDLYLIHWPVSWQPVPLESNLLGAEAPVGGERGTKFSNVSLSSTWREMEKLVEEGLVRQIGVSNFGVQLLADLLSYCKIRPACNQVEIHPYNSQPSLLKVNFDVCVGILIQLNILGMCILGNRCGCLLSPWFL